MANAGRPAESRPFVDVRDRLNLVDSRTGAATDYTVSLPAKWRVFYDDNNDGSTGSRDPVGVFALKSDSVENDIRSLAYGLRSDGTSLPQRGYRDYIVPTPRRREDGFVVVLQGQRPGRIVGVFSNERAEPRRETEFMAWLRTRNLKVDRRSASRG